MSANEPNVTKLPKNLNRTESEKKKKKQNKKKQQKKNKKKNNLHYFTPDQIVFDVEQQSEQQYLVLLDTEK